MANKTKEPKRPIRIANCSGATPDPGELMLAQAVSGPVDVITGDYLAEQNLALSAEGFSRGEHPGYIASALRGLELSLTTIQKKKIKVVINGGALNPKGLAEKTRSLAVERGISAEDLKIAYVEGDNLFSDVREILRPRDGKKLPHLDSMNEDVRLAPDSDNFLDDPENKKIVAANAYLGCRAIRKGLDEGADIIICGRVADASPVMGAAQWWHGWGDDRLDELAGALVAGHLIECSTYGTGGNFAGFDEYPIERMLNLGCPIAEVAADGSCVVTKHDKLNGLVNEEVVKCQMLYELQGRMYLNSDVKADIQDVKMRQVGPNRVHVCGTRGLPPPPTTKLAVFYRGGYQGEMTVNASGYATERKFALQEAQVRDTLKRWGNLDQKLDVLEFQRAGVPAINPRSQLSSTTYLRIFAQAAKADTVRAVLMAWMSSFMQHFPGMHCTLDLRQISEPLPFLGYFPALVEQTRIRETVTFLGAEQGDEKRRCFEVGPPKLTEPLGPRESYDPPSPVESYAWGPTRTVPLGDVVLARSGDKGANVNVGFTPRQAVNNERMWSWLRNYLTRGRIQEMMGDDWQDWFHVERCEFPGLRAVHFVVYGALGRGVSSSSRLDSLGKGFAEWLRAVHVPVPVEFLDQVEKQPKQLERSSKL